MIQLTIVGENRELVRGSEHILVSIINLQLVSSVWSPVGLSTAVTQKCRREFRILRYGLTLEVKSQMNQHMFLQTEIKSSKRVYAYMLIKIKHQNIHPSIHPFSAAYPLPGHGGSRKGSSDILLHSNNIVFLVTFFWRQTYI